MKTFVFQIILLFFCFLPTVLLDVPEGCFISGLQYAGVALNEPERDRTPTAEDCQRFCQTVFDCTDFSWVDNSHGLEEMRLRCTLWSETMVLLVDEYYVSGPKECWNMNVWNIHNGKKWLSTLNVLVSKKPNITSLLKSKWAGLFLTCTISLQKKMFIKV